MANAEERIRRLEQLREKARELAQRIGAPADSLPPFGDSRDGYYVDYDGLYRWIARERGEERDHRLTLDEDEVLYWIFEQITLGMGTEYEVEHRVPNQDSRRMLFGKQIELMTKLNPNWGERRKQELDAVLAQNPYDDRRGLTPAQLLAKTKALNLHTPSESADMIRRDRDSP